MGAVGTGDGGVTGATGGSGLGSLDPSPLSWACNPSSCPSPLSIGAFAASSSLSLPLAASSPRSAGRPGAGVEGRAGALEALDDDRDDFFDERDRPDFPDRDERDDRDDDFDDEDAPEPAESADAEPEPAASADATTAADIAAGSTDDGADVGAFGEEAAGDPDEDVDFPFFFPGHERPKKPRPFLDWLSLPPSSAGVPADEPDPFAAPQIEESSELLPASQALPADEEPSNRSLMMVRSL